MSAITGHFATLIMINITSDLAMMTTKEIMIMIVKEVRGKSERMIMMAVISSQILMSMVRAIIRPMAAVLAMAVVVPLEEAALNPRAAALAMAAAVPLEEAVLSPRAAVPGMAVVVAVAVAVAIMEGATVKAQALAWH